MKTTLVLDDALVEQVRQRARERGVSMSSIVEEAIFRMVNAPTPTPASEWRLPVYDSGGYLVDVNDRDALYDAMDEQ